MLALGTSAHLLARAMALAPDECSTAVRFAGWTGFKIVAWLIPTWALVRPTERSFAWLGVDTSRG